MEILYQQVQARESNSEAQLDEYRKRLLEMETKMSRLLAAQQGAPNILTINGDNARVLQMDVKVIHGAPAVFGDEDVSHIGTGDVLRILQAVAPHAGTDFTQHGPADTALVKNVSDQLITHAAMLVFSDPERPHNITCYLPRAHGRQAMTHGRNGWALMPVNIVFPPMVRRAINLLFDHQPIAGVDFEGRASAYRTILSYISEHESELSANSDSTMRPILVRNEGLIRKTRAVIEQRDDGARIADLIGDD